jgi:putative transcriptional regulator
MKNGGTTQVDRDPGDPLPEDGTDWEAVAAMTDDDIHAAALADPDAQPLPPDGKGLRHLVNVRKLRLGMTQDAFSAAYRIPVGTLRDWEQRRKNPDATARAYLELIDADPAGVAATLAARAA